MKKQHHIPKKQRGQSLVEMGLTLMILLWLLAGVIDFGMGFFSYIALRDAAQEGALYGSLCQNTTKIQSRVQQSSTTPVIMTNTTVTISTPSGTAAGDQLTVTVLYNYPVSTPIINNFVGGPTIAIHASSTSTILKNDLTCTED